MTTTNLPFDPDALREKYRRERDKRLRDDGNQQYIEVVGEFAHFIEDPYVKPGFHREPLTDEVDVAVIGGGFGGLLAGARLREAGVERAQRIQFVTVVSQGTIQSAYRVPYAVFAKGEKGDKMIIVGMQQGELNTVYRMRALLANMTTMSRLSPFFQERTVAEDATFFDLLKLLGFRELTVTDGEKVTHQVTIK